ncbi:MAG: iron-sulfur cluster insertion protein ErpA [Thermoplasmata archaeon]
MIELSLTEAAAQEIRTLMEKEGDSHSYLRVFVTGGGCSGLSYGMTFEEKEDEGDQVVESNGVKLLVDEFSAPYLKGIEVDYQQSLMGTGFVINNPNAKSSCACGQSFSA